MKIFERSSVVTISLMLIIFLSASVWAGSYFSSRSNSVGARTYTTGVRGLGMGGTGLASLDSLSLNYYVVSQWRNINNTRATFGLFYDYTNSEVGSNSFSTSAANFAGLSFGIPIQTKKWVFGVSVQPYTDINFRTRQEITRFVGADTTSFEQVLQQEGNISRAQFNLIWAPVEQVGLAIHASYYFGTLEDNYRFEFTDPAFASTNHIVEYRVSGPGLGFSMDVRPTKDLILAGFFDLKPSLNISSSYISQNTNIEGSERVFDSFPVSYGVGGTYRVGKRWNLAADYAFQKWSETLLNSDGGYEDWSHLGFGVERMASTRRTRALGFWQKIDIRAGASSRQLGYRFNNESVRENSLHFGLGLPFFQKNYRLDAGFAAGFRGDSAKNLASESFFRFELSVSVGEKWFQRIQ